MKHAILVFNRTKKGRLKAVPPTGKPVGFPAMNFMINIYEKRYYDDESVEIIVYMAKDKQEARAFIGKVANDLNHGLVRHWVYDYDPGETHYVYNCGRVTYYTKESIKEEE